MMHFERYPESDQTACGLKAKREISISMTRDESSVNCGKCLKNIKVYSAKRFVERRRAKERERVIEVL